MPRYSDACDQTRPDTVSDKEAGTRRIAFGIAGAAFALGVTLPLLAILDGWFPPMVAVGGLIPGAAFVAVSIWAARVAFTAADETAPGKLKRVVGAGAGAFSAPLYYFVLHELQHPLDAGADLGRAFVALLAPFVLLLNMKVGAMAAHRVGQPVTVGRTPEWLKRAALAIGLGAVLVALLVLWRAGGDGTPNPEVASWEFIHHGLVPAIPILAVGVCTMAFPRRLIWMSGALVGVIPALACSAIFVDPDPGDRGQTLLTLVAYTLPLTLPITVGCGILAADSARRRVQQAVPRRSVRR